MIEPEETIWVYLRIRPFVSHQNDNEDNEMLSQVIKQNKNPQNETSKYKPDLNQSEIVSSKLKVKQNPNIQSSSSLQKISITKHNDTQALVQHNNKLFNFTKIFDHEDDNQQIFNQVVLSHMDFIFTGNNFSLFMYGQTNSGKTYTMKGHIQDAKTNAVYQLLSESSKKSRIITKPGLIQLTLEELYRRSCISNHTQSKLQISYYEIYQEKIYDLLSDNQLPLEIRELQDNKTKILNLTTKSPLNLNDALKIFQEGENRRKFAQTKWNHKSSRSHVIFVIEMEIWNKLDFKKNCFPTITLADLAGSESIGAQEDVKEGSFINKSLLALTSLIQKLSKGQQNVSFRESKLTWILKPFLSGNSKTSVICTVNPNQQYIYESLNTLRFGQTASGVNIQYMSHNSIEDKSKEEAAQRESNQQQLNELNKKLQEIQEQLQQAKDLKEQQENKFNLINNNFKVLKQSREFVKNINEQLQIENQELLSNYNIVQSNLDELQANQKITKSANDIQEQLEEQKNQQQQEQEEENNQDNIQQKSEEVIDEEIQNVYQRLYKENQEMKQKLLQLKKDIIQNSKQQQNPEELWRKKEQEAQKEIRRKQKLIQEQEEKEEQLLAKLQILKAQIQRQIDEKEILTIELGKQNQNLISIN